MRLKRFRVRVRSVRRVVRSLWDDAVDPLDRAVARLILRDGLSPTVQMRLLRTWLFVTHPF